MTTKIVEIEWAWPKCKIDKGYETLVREMTSYDVLCPLCCQWKWTEDSLGFGVPPSSYHWSRIYEWPWAIQNADLRLTDIILEGGGAGCVVKYAIAKRCRRVITLDNDNKALADVEEIQFSALRELVPQVDKIDLVVADLHDIPFPDNSFDSSLCISTLEHTQDHKKCIDELVRVTKPGRPILVSVDVVLNGKATKEFNIDTEGVVELVKAYGRTVPGQVSRERFMGRTFGELVLGCLCFKIVKE